MKDKQEYFYNIKETIGEGTYSEVFKAVDTRSQETVALKKVKIRNADHGLPKEFVREIESLQRILHPNVIQIKEVFVGKTNINIIYPFCATDLDKLMSKMRRPFTVDEIRYLVHSMLKGINELHKIGLMHRDIKPSNLLINSNCNLQLADFGQARVFKQNGQFSLEVGTKWYKAPEVLYCCRDYNEKVDMWSLGCILAELLDHTALFTGTSDIDQLAKIARIMGCPDPSEPWYQQVPPYARLNLPDAKRQDFKEMFKARAAQKGGSEAINLLDKLLVYNSKQRSSVEAALQHDFFAASGDCPKSLHQLLTTL